MATRVIVGVVALACGSICGMISTFTLYEMMDKVNEKLPKDEQFAALWWYASKYQRLRRAYKTLYPDGRLLVKLRMLAALMFSCFLICFWGFGFFAK
jgi:hypothetical protein